jgi:hypothetical protein
MTSTHSTPQTPKPAYTILHIYYRLTMYYK